MSITGMLFIFMFLPLSLAVYYLANDRAKEYVLLFLSLVFYALGSLKNLPVFIAAIALTVVIARLTGRMKEGHLRTLVFAFGAAANILLLVYYKYMGGMALPLGISFYTFKAVSYLADVYKGKVTPEGSPVHDLLYLSFFAQIQSGPLSRYADMTLKEAPTLRGMISSGSFQDGIYRFLIGFNKKVLLADTLSKITNEIFASDTGSMSTAYVWLGSLCYSLELFYDFAGYSDMAIGITGMFGYKCRENFDYPYITDSVSHFWRRWHISLSEWFRDYVYFPLGGSRKGGRLRLAFNLFVVWLLTGLWHGTSWNFIIWGLGYFVVIFFEHLTGLPKKIGSEPGRIIYRILTLIFINCQWVMFKSASALWGLKFIKRMFVFTSVPLSDVRTGFLIRDYGFFIGAALVLTTPVIGRISKAVSGKKGASGVVSLVYPLIIFALFVWAVSFVVSGQNNPFAYANF